MCNCLQHAGALQQLQLQEDYRVIHTMVYNWDRFQETITRLYVDEHKPVDEIIKYMSAKYGFTPRYAPPPPRPAPFGLRLPSRYGDDARMARSCASARSYLPP